MLNAFAERWVRSVKQECLSKVILFGETSLWRVLTEYSRHYHHERNYQGKDDRLLFVDERQKARQCSRTSSVASDSAENPTGFSVKDKKPFCKPRFVEFLRITPNRVRVFPPNGVPGCLRVPRPGAASGEARRRIVGIPERSPGLRWIDRTAETPA